MVHTKILTFGIKKKDWILDEPIIQMLREANMAWLHYRQFSLTQLNNFLASVSMLICIQLPLKSADFVKKIIQENTTFYKALSGCHEKGSHNKIFLKNHY